MGKTANSQFNSDIEKYKKYLIKGLKEEVNSRIEEAIINTLTEVSEAAYKSSQNKVPLDEGDLQATGKISEIRRDGNSWGVTISYGDSASNYAYFVHENMPSAFPDKTYSNQNGERGPKYLERAMDEQASSNMLTNKLRDNLRKVTK
jgi:hypothetical protein